MGRVVSVHLYLKLLSFILFHQALRILYIRPIIGVRLLEAHIHEEALKVIWNFQSEKAAVQTFSFFSFFSPSIFSRKGHRSGGGFGTPSFSLSFQEYQELLLTVVEKSF